MDGKKASFHPAHDFTKSQQQKKRCKHGKETHSIADVAQLADVTAHAYLQLTLHR